MRQRDIEMLASRFRDGIENAIADGAIAKYNKLTLRYFPHGCCQIASDLLAEYLLENGIKTQCIHGEFYFDYKENKYPHSWLETFDGYIIDITADQFRNKPGFEGKKLPPCYVGKNRSLYDLFSEAKRNDGIFCGLDIYTGEYNAIVQNAYRTIMEYIK